MSKGGDLSRGSVPHEVGRTAPACAATQGLATQGMSTEAFWVRRGGAIIKDIREASGANIKILPPEELPPCGLSNDRVVQCVPSLRGMHALGPPHALGTPHLDATRGVLCSSVIPDLPKNMPLLSIQWAAEPIQLHPGGRCEEQGSAACTPLLAACKATRSAGISRAV